ncbi:MAG: hypothetical protein ACI9MR_001363 [Myxococcota bacterium]
MAPERPGADPALPGLGEGDPALMKTLGAALRKKAKGYVPRTHHKHGDGTAKFVNRLILETSPYLLQHAHNPVNWYPWGDAAFERAKREGKPVLMSIGYSTCHWCHVMERESFEDLEIAEYINTHFVAVKVDREERPDVDDIYMKAVNMLAGRGGWPMTTMLTDKREPFFGGTYFPARTGDRGARKGFFQILQEMSDRYKNERETVVAEATKISQRIASQAQPQRPGNVPSEAALVATARTLASRFEPKHGGFGNAPKFPRPVTMRFLLRYGRRTKDPKALEMVVYTLDKMAAGGMHDQVGGGFHRYSVDSRWLVPHFEKMLYDNAQLASLYLEAYQATGEQRHADIAAKTLDYVALEMTSPEGGFFSATDADSPVPGTEPVHYEEGLSFTWTPSELDAELGVDVSKVVQRYHGVSARGNFERRNILHRPQPDANVAKALGMDVPTLLKTINAAHKLLYVAREKRLQPIKDTKIITAWNGLMLSAFARGALVLDRADYRARAEAAADFIFAKLRRPDGTLLRTFKAGTSKFNAYLADYAFVIEGLLDLFEATGDVKQLSRAIGLQTLLDARHLDREIGGYFATSNDHEQLIARTKPSYDGAEPSGNSAALLNLLRLAEFTGIEAYRTTAEKGFAAFSASLTRGGMSLPKMVGALDYYLDSPREVVIVRPSAADAKDSPTPLIDVLRTTFLPNRVAAAVQEGEGLNAVAKRMPLVGSKTALKGQATAYVCERGICEAPTSDPVVFRKQLETVVRPLRMNDVAPPALTSPEPGRTPKAWEYDAKTDQHWHPGHGHWHKGKPPAKP